MQYHINFKAVHTIYITAHALIIFLCDSNISENFNFFSGNFDSELGRSPDTLVLITRRYLTHEHAFLFCSTHAAESIHVIFFFNVINFILNIKRGNGVPQPMAEYSLFTYSSCYGKKIPLFFRPILLWIFKILPHFYEIYFLN